MAYTRKAPKSDIRSLSIKSLEPKTANQPTEIPLSPLSHIPQIRYSLELRRVLWCSIPLVTLLIIATYLETTQHWVIPFATKLLKLGS